MNAKQRAKLHETLDAILDFDTSAFKDDAEYYSAEGHRDFFLIQMKSALAAIKDPYSVYRKLGCTEEEIEKEKARRRESYAKPKKAAKKSRTLL